MSGEVIFYSEGRTKALRKLSSTLEPCSTKSYRNLEVYRTKSQKYVWQNFKEIDFPLKGTKFQEKLSSALEEGQNISENYILKLFFTLELGQILSGQYWWRTKAQEQRTNAQSTCICKRKFCLKKKKKMQITSGYITVSNQFTEDRSITVLKTGIPTHLWLFEQSKI